MVASLNSRELRKGQVRIGGQTEMTVLLVVRLMLNKISSRGQTPLLCSKRMVEVATIRMSFTVRKWTES